MKARCCSPVGANKCHGMLGVGSESQTHVHRQGRFICKRVVLEDRLCHHPDPAAPLPKISPQRWLLHLCPIISAGLEPPETFPLQHLHIHPPVPPPAKEAALTVAVLTRSGPGLIKKFKLTWNFEHRHPRSCCFQPNLSLFTFLSTAGLCPRLPAQMPMARNPQDSQQHPGCSAESSGARQTASGQGNHIQIHLPGIAQSSTCRDPATLSTPCPQPAKGRELPPHSTVAGDMRCVHFILLFCFAAITFSPSGLL